jgi:hypothetical protein
LFRAGHLSGLLADSFRGKDRGVAFGAWGAVTDLG